MLTGDALPVAREIARVLGLGEIIRAPELHAEQAQAAPADDPAGGGFAEVFPEDKYLVVQSLQAAGHVVGMTGDGVNDAPALRQAEVGIAVSGATDVAKGAASAVLTTEGLTNIVDLVKSGRATYQRVLTWIREQGQPDPLEGRLRGHRLPGDRKVRHLGAGDAAGRVPHRRRAHRAGDRSRGAFAEAGDMEDRSAGPGRRPPRRADVGRGARLCSPSAGTASVSPATMAGSRPSPSRPSSSSRSGSLLSVRERRSFWKSRPSAALAASLAAAAAGAMLIGLRGVAELSPIPLTENAPRLRLRSLLFAGAERFSSSRSSTRAHSAVQARRRVVGREKSILRCSRTARSTTPWPSPRTTYARSTPTCAPRTT